MKQPEAKDLIGNVEWELAKAAQWKGLTELEVANTSLRAIAYGLMAVAQAIKEAK